MDDQTTHATKPTGSPDGPRQAAAAAAPAGPAPPNPVVMLRRTLNSWPVTVIVMMLGAVITLMVVRGRKLSFKSETTIFYREGIRALAEPGVGDPNMRNLSVRLKETLLSQSNLRRVIDEFHLYEAMVKSRGYVDAVDAMRTKITFKSKSTETFLISYEGLDRDEVQAVTNRLAELVVEETRRLQHGQAATAVDFLRSERKHSEEALSEAEREAAGFLAEHPEFAYEGPGVGASIRAEDRRNGPSNKEPLARQAARLRHSLVAGPREKPGVISAVPVAGAPVERSGPAVPVAPPDPNGGLRTTALQEVGAARKDLEDKRAKFTDRHPDVLNASARVKRAEEALAAIPPPPEAAAPAAGAVEPGASPGRALTGGDDPYAPVPVAKDSAARDQIQAQLSRLEKEMDAKKHPRPGSAESEAQRIMGLETEWSRIGRDIVVARSHLNDVESKANRAEVQESAEQGGFGSSVAVLDPAFKPTTAIGAPNKTIFIAGCVGSFLFGLVLAALRGLLFDDRIYAASETEGLGAVLVVVPAVAVVKEGPSPAERARMARAWLLADRRRLVCAAVAFTVVAAGGAYGVRKVVKKRLATAAAAAAASARANAGARPNGSASPSARAAASAALVVPPPVVPAAEPVPAPSASAAPASAPAPSPSSQARPADSAAPSDPR